MLVWLEDKPRPLTDGEEAECMEALPLPFPEPVFTSRSALAPKLIRRAKAVVGDPFDRASPSSIAFSSMEMDGEVPLEKLSCRALALAKADAWVGEPEMPRDVIDILRRC